MLRLAFVALSLLLPGCMARIPLSPQGQAAAQPAAQTETRPRLWYLGLGLFDESWSEGDVAATADRLLQQAQGFQVVPAVFSYAPDHRFLAPDRANVDAITAEIARRAGPGDVVMLYVSTHGAPGLLAREADRRERQPATAEELREWLAPLGNRPTIVVLSACFSGSFIPALRADNRIIFAAARPDRTSFGCQAGAEHTVFGDALLTALASSPTSFADLVARVRQLVAAREHELGVRLPSDPQISVGPAVTTLYQTPLF